MPALHLHEAAGCRDVGALGEKHDGSSPFGQSRRNARTTQQGVEFFPLVHGQRNDWLTLCHGNILVQETLNLASLISGS
jgi:hypothetical protein